MKAKTFEKYIKDWFREYLLSHEDDDNFYNELLDFIGYNPDEYIDENESAFGFLIKLSADEIWDCLFGYKNRNKQDDDLDEKFDDIPYYDIYKNLMNQAFNVDEWEFAEDFIDAMSEDMSDYDTPLGYFKDFATNPNFVQFAKDMHTDRECLETYGRFCNDLERFRKYLVNLGLADEKEADNPKDLPHYVFMDWFCYEKLGMLIASVLYPTEF